VKLKEVSELPSDPNLFWGHGLVCQRMAGRKGLSGTSLGVSSSPTPPPPACPPGMSHGSAEQCVEGGAGAGTKMSAKSRMEDCGGERHHGSGVGRAQREGRP
jgi:hypothetical protein